VITGLAGVMPKLTETGSDILEHPFAYVADTQNVPEEVTAIF